MLKKSMILLSLLGAFSYPCWAAEDDPNQVLISKDFVTYFKRVSSETSIPITLSVDVYDEIKSRERIKNEKSVPLGEFPETVTLSALLELFPSLKELLPLLTHEHDPNDVIVHATIYVNAPQHTEKVDGHRSLQALSVR